MPIHRNAGADTLALHAGQTPDPLALHFPNSFDGLQGLRFVDSVIRSSAANGAWVDCPTSD